MNEKQALIVEDALNWAKQHQLALDGLGFKTAVVNDYAEALGLLRRERFDVAIVDLCLTTHSEPENLNGVFLLQYLAEKNSGDCRHRPRAAQACRSHLSRLRGV